jgi:HrpA-like RNA helicase
MVDPKSLPIRRYEGEIVQAVKDSPVVVVIGETGSGKTTQLAQVRNYSYITRRFCR